jgi:hypothetical protein
MTEPYPVAAHANLPPGAATAPGFVAERVREPSLAKGAPNILAARTFTWEEVRDVSVPDDPWRLLRRTVAESGEGA